MFKRVTLFILTNLLIIAMVSIIMSVFGLHGYLTQHGIDYKSLAIFCLLWGTGGAFISLLISRFMAKRAFGVQLIDPQTTNAHHRQLLQTVNRLVQKANLKAMPEVGIYDSPEVNAFATGPSKKRSLVAVSTGLLSQLNQDEVEGVLAHEITHIANGDMVTMTFIQGIVNAFALFLSRIVAYAIATAMSGNDREGGESGISFLAYYILAFIFDIIFTLLGSIVTAAFSRWREYRADAGGAKLAGRQKMISALERLKAGIDTEDKRAPSMNTLKISHKPGLIALFASHPPLEQRIKRLRSRSY